MSDHKDNTHSRSLDNVLAGVLHEARAAASGVDPLRGHPGRGRDTLDNGRSRLFVKPSADATRSEREEVIWQRAIVEYEKGEKLCESPIERNMLAAMLTADWGYFSTENAVVHNVVDFEEDFPDANVVLVPQLQIARYRLDFGLMLRLGRGKQLFALECDGKQFHNSATDRERDWYLNSYGVITLRFSGADLNAGPLSAVDEAVVGIFHWWEAAFAR